MPFLRLTEKGFEKYTGLLGEIHFKDGLSIENISRADARRLASIMGIVDVEDGRNPSETQEMVETRGMTVEEIQEYRSVDPQSAAKIKEQEVKEEEPAKQAPVSLDFSFSQEDLEKIADEQGIEGLRAFAEPYDVRGPSIIAIIKSLMAAKKRHEAEAKAKAKAE